MSLKRVSRLLLAAVVAGACERPVATSPAASVATVVVTPQSGTVLVGGVLQLVATPQDSNGTPLSGPSITWSSSASGTASVDANGKVTGMAAGSAAITATSEGKSGDASVTVMDAPVATVTVTPPSGTVAIGGTVQLGATLQDASGHPLSGRSVAWISSSAAVATVSTNGLVTAAAVGSVTITATSEGKSGTASITVTDVPVSSVEVVPASASVAQGGTVQLMATPRDASGNALAGRVVTWTSSSSGVATVSATGLVTGVGAGSATITATTEGKTGTSSISVTFVPVASVAVTPPAPSIQVGQTVQLSATPSDASGTPLTGRVVTWSSSNSAVASVSSSGLVTGKAAGSATITATSEGKSGSAAVTVTTIPVASVTVAPSAPSIVVGGSVQLTATPRDGAGNALTGRAIAWVSDKTSIATVSASGLVTGAMAGSATVTATSEGKSGSATVTVTGGGSGGLVTDATAVFSEPVATKPGYLTPVTPQPFGTTITRIAGDNGTSFTFSTGGSGTWGTDVRHHYSKDQPWSADGSLLTLQNNGSPSMIFLDGNTYQPVRGKCSNYSSGDDRWHPSPMHPHERINVNGSELMWFDVVTCTKTRSWTLPFSVDYFGSGEGNPSFDGRFAALANATQMFVVDMEGNKIGPARDLTDCGLASGCSIDWVSISPSGKYAVVTYNGDYPRVFDVDPTTLALTPRPMRQIYANCHGTAAQGFVYDLGHADMTFNPFDNNEEVLIGQEHCGNRGKTVSGILIGGVMMTRLKDGAITPLTNPANEAYPDHISTRAYDRPGWVYVGYYNGAGQRFNDEIVALRLDGQAVERLAHKHSAFSGCYRCESHSVPSRDGLRVLFASNWALDGDGTSSVIQDYIVDTRSLR